MWTFANECVRLIEPLDYLDFVRLMDTAERIATDSGGIQKEAFFLDTYSVTLRDETEWVETVDAGWNRIVGAEYDVISEALSTDWERPTEKPEPYGGGDTARVIRETLEEYVG